MRPAQLEISSDKLTPYLLNLAHPIGGPKAKFFLSHGFQQSAPDVLATSLFEYAAVGWPGTVTDTQYGQRHAIVGPMAFPNGSVGKVRSVWQIAKGSDSASLLTAFPG